MKRAAMMAMAVAPAWRAATTSRGMPPRRRQRAHRRRHVRRGGTVGPRHPSRPHGRLPQSIQLGSKLGGAPRAVSTKTASTQGNSSARSSSQCQLKRAAGGYASGFLLAMRPRTMWTRPGPSMSVRIAGCLIARRRRRNLTQWALRSFRDDALAAACRCLPWPSCF